LPFSFSPTEREGRERGGEGEEEVEQTMKRKAGEMGGPREKCVYLIDIGERCENGRERGGKDERGSGKVTPRARGIWGINKGEGVGVT
jgi:hypothetical protein